MPRLSIEPGDGTVCGGTCDGTETQACQYPVVECAPASCAGSTRTLAATCSEGICPAGVEEACAVTCGGTDCATVTQVATGYYNTCALMSDTTVRCWGRNVSGSLGTGDEDDRDTPTPVPGLSGVIQISASAYHTCALLEDHTMKCWGDNGFGELGIGAADDNPHVTPEVVLDEAGTAPLSDIHHISAGQFRTCAVTGTGNSSNTRCWGLNLEGSLGDGTITDRPLPSPVCSSGSVDTTCTRMTNVSRVVTGKFTTCARGASGNAFCWGSNSVGQLGLFSAGAGAYVADPDDHPNPVSVKDPANTAFPMGVNAILPSNSENGGTTCAIRSIDQVVLCWGSNNQGILGRNSFVSTLAGRETPKPVCKDDLASCTPLTASAIGVGYFHACAISADKVRCWGDDAWGQLGDGTETDKSFAGIEVPLGEAAVDLAVSEFHTCALLLSGKVKCWGHGSGLGVPGLSESANPVTPQW